MADHKVSSLDTLNTLIAQIYDAAADPSLWTAFLESLSHVYGGGTTTMYLHDFGSQRSFLEHPSLSFLNIVNTDEEWRSVYENYYCALNVWEERSAALAEGTVMCSNPLITDTELFKTEFYNDWLRKRGYRDFIAANLLKRDSVMVSLANLRTGRNGQPSEAELDLCRRLVPHLQRACGLYLKLAGSQALTDASFAVLDRFPQGVVLFDSKGRVRFANQSAETIIRAGDGFSVDGERRCCAGAPNETAKLQRLIQEAVQTGRGAGQSAGGALMLSRLRASRPLSVVVSPLRSRGFAIVDDLCAVLFVTDPDKSPADALPLFAALYGLTPAETRVLEQLLRHESTQDIADALQISIKTLRTHLSALFAKTRTSGQRELVRFFLAHPPASAQPPSAE